MLDHAYGERLSKRKVTSENISRVLRALRSGDWLGLDRIRGYSIILATLSCLFAVWWVLMCQGAIALGGQPLGSDFVSFKAAADLALAGHPADAFVRSLHHAAEKAAVGDGAIGYFAFFYPPVYLLICLPLGLAPYFAAFGLWLAATGAAYVAVLRRILPERQALLPILAFPAILIEFTHGQNAFLTTALLGAALLVCDRHPAFSGVLFGCLCYKPQFAILLPVALLAGRHWRCLASAAGTALLLSAVSLAVFGLESWTGFIAGGALARRALEDGLVGFGKMQSVFAAVRLLGGPVGLAYLLQGLTTLAVAAAIGQVWRSRVGLPVRAAMLAVGSVLATPFVLDYDFMLLSLGIAWLVRDGMATGFRPFEKMAALALFLLPLGARSLAMDLHAPLSPLVVGTFFLLLTRRALAERAAAGDRSPTAPRLAPC